MIYLVRCSHFWLVLTGSAPVARHVDYVPHLVRSVGNTSYVPVTFPESVVRRTGQVAKVNPVSAGIARKVFTNPLPT